MATKQNMYVGINKEAKEILAKINKCIVMYSVQEDDLKEILAYDTSIEQEIRDQVANLQGKLQVLIKGLDKNSPQKKL